MHKNHTMIGCYGSILAVAVSLLLFSCASTSLTASWHDSAYSTGERLTDVLIIAVTEEETVRRLYEEGFVAKFAESEVRAFPSYSLTIPDIEPTEAAVRAAVDAADARFVLITRHLGTDTKQYYHPPEPLYIDPYYSRYNRYYPLAYREAHYRPGYTYNVTTVSIESNIYDAETEKLVWSARSKSIDPKLTQKYFDELVSTFAGDLKQKGLL